MTVSELAEKFKCYVMAGHGDCIVVCDGREIDKSYHFDKTPQERECVRLSLKLIKKPSKAQLKAKLNRILNKRKTANAVGKEDKHETLQKNPHTEKDHKIRKRNQNDPHCQDRPI